MYDAPSSMYLHANIYTNTADLGTDPVVEHSDNASSFAVRDDIKHLLRFSWSTHWYLQKKSR